MTSRKEYEAWFEREYPVEPTGKRSKYQGSMVQDLMFSAWQAAERQALERAAQICDENIDPAEAAFEIRALIDAQSGEEKK